MFTFILMASMLTSSPTYAQAHAHIRSRAELYAAMRATREAEKRIHTPVLRPWIMHRYNGTCSTILMSDGDGGMHPRLVCVPN